MTTPLFRPVPVAETVAAVRKALDSPRRRGMRIGFVPTMGALHAGHVSLLTAARRECEFVVASIFVNPTQFAPHEDFQQYPRPWEADLQLCAQAGVDLVFHPAPEQMYPSGFCTTVEVSGLSELWEGASRPGHFRGVTTIVQKLFAIVGPDAAYFGQKDYQQQTIIRKMCADLNLPLEIRVCPTIREPDGLALSSRNVYLREDERSQAVALSQSLQLAEELILAGETDGRRVRERMREHLRAQPLVQPDYAVLADPDTLQELAELPPRCVALVAARVGRTRLIDNRVIERPPPIG